MTKMKNDHAWFTYVRSSYLPANSTGLIIYLIYLGYLLALLADWLRNGHHMWYFLVDVVPLSVGAALVTQYIASRHAK